MLKIKKYFYQKRKSGFTLIEVLLVTAIMSVLMLALYQALSNGLRVWEKSREFSIEEDLMIVFDKFSMDLRNSFDFSLFDFKGKSNNIIFSTIVHVPMGLKESEHVIIYTDQIGRVTYGFDLSNKAVYRQQANYGQSVEGDFGKKVFLAKPVNRISFRYFKRSKKGLVVRRLGKDQLPDAIEISIKYENSQGVSRILTRLVNVPLML